MSTATRCLAFGLMYPWIPANCYLYWFLNVKCSCSLIFIVASIFVVLLQLTKVERISQKLHIMSFIGNFFDTFHHLQPVCEIVLVLLFCYRWTSTCLCMLALLCWHTVFIASVATDCCHFSAHTCTLWSEYFTVSHSNNTLLVSLLQCLRVIWLSSVIFTVFVVFLLCFLSYPIQFYNKN